MSEHDQDEDRRDQDEERMGGPHAYEPVGGRTPREVTARTGDKHELRDVHTRSVIVFMVLVLVFVGVVTLVIGGFGLALNRQTAPERSAPTPLQAVQPVPPEPRLQSSPKADMILLLDQENMLLNNYGWVDRTGGVVRIPVDRAMALIAERGFPPRRNDIPTTAGAAVTTATLTGGMPR